jgi:type II secretory pathway pseudopilin PulG
MTNDETLIASNSGSRPSLIHSSLESPAAPLPALRVIRHSSFRKANGFTILELLIVITIIIILAALILGTMGYVQKKAARSRTEAEIAAMSAACESYKADNGTYPRDTGANATDTLDPQKNADPSQSVYTAASLYFFTQLSGLDSSQKQTPGAKSYFNFKPQMLGGIKDPNGNITTVRYIRDPFGNSYGYSTAYQADVANNVSPPQRGYNPTFDLWSTGGETTGSANSPQWLKNW